MKNPTLILALFLGLYVLETYASSGTIKAMFKKRGQGRDLPLYFKDNGELRCPGSIIASQRSRGNVLKRFGITVATRFQEDPTREDYCKFFWTCDAFHSGSKSFRGSCEYFQVFEPSKQRCIFFTYSKTKCNQYFAHEDRNEIAMEKTKYDIEEGLKKKLLRIKNSNYSKQGKINQEKIAKQAAEDARKAMRENYRQQQIFKEQNGRAKREADPEAKSRPERSVAGRDLTEFVQMTRNADGSFSCPIPELLDGKTEAEVLEAGRELKHNFSPFNFYKTNSFHHGFQTRLPIIMADGKSDCTHYFECGWQQHINKDNRPEVKTCEKNAVYQPSKVSKTHSTDGHTFVPNTGRCINNTEIFGDDMAHCVGLFTELTINPDTLQPYGTEKLAIKNSPVINDDSTKEEVSVEDKEGEINDYLDELEKEQEKQASKNDPNFDYPNENPSEEISPKEVDPELPDYSETPVEQKEMPQNLKFSKAEINDYIDDLVKEIKGANSEFVQVDPKLPAVDDSSKELTESKAIDSLDDFYPEEPFETTDDEINDFVDAFEKSQEGDDPYINDLIEEPSEISPKENWAALPEVDDFPNQSFETKPDYVQKEVLDSSFKTADKEPRFQFFKPKPKLETVEKPFEPELIAEKPQRKIEPPMKPATDFQRVIERKPEWEIVEKTNLPKSTLTGLEKFWADRIKGLEDHKAAERKIFQAQQIIQAQQKVQPGFRVVEKKFEPKLTAREAGLKAHREAEAKIIQAQQNIQPKLKMVGQTREQALQAHRVAESKIIQAQQKIIQAQQKIQPNLDVGEKMFWPKLTARQMALEAHRLAEEKIIQAQQKIKNKLKVVKDYFGPKLTAEEKSKAIREAGLKAHRDAEEKILAAQRKNVALG